MMVREGQGDLCWQHDMMMITKPKIYVHYVDNIFIATDYYNEINKLKQTLEKNTILNFTTELIINKKNPFLWCTH